MAPTARWRQHVDGDFYGPRKQAKAQSVSARVEGEVGQPSVTILMHSSTVSKMLSGVSITCSVLSRPSWHVSATVFRD
jgi:hypothetical protein